MGSEATSLFVLYDWGIETSGRLKQLDILDVSDKPGSYRDVAGLLVL